MNSLPLKTPVELIYERSCPNVARAREVIARACQAVGVQAIWQEWEVSDPVAPEYVRHYGSPSILVAGKDVSLASANDCACCRLYPENTEFIGCPSFDDVVRALREIK